MRPPPLNLGLFTNFLTVFCLVLVDWNYTSSSSIFYVLVFLSAIKLSHVLQCIF